MKENPMDVDSYAEGAPFWVSLQTADPDAAAQFYGRLLAWEFAPASPGNEGHRTALLRGRPAAGVGVVGDSGRSGWLTYVAVRDTDETARSVQAAGGTVVSSPVDVSGLGRQAVFADPSGAQFAVWEAGSRAGAGAASEPGAFTWGELITDDVEASAAFYGAVFGWTVTAPEGPLQRREWQLDGRSISGLLPRPPAMAVDIPVYWDVYFAVADVAAAAGTVTAIGGTQLMPPTDIGTATIAVFLDPTGSVFTVTAPHN
jgi:predicted enzyme related to lactoylglutathione lyase